MLPRGLKYDDFPEESDEQWMLLALKEARTASDANEVPVGAVIVCENHLIASSHNQREELQDPTAHAEILAITQAAAEIGFWRLENTILYVTLEPCIMCAGAVLQARIPRVVFGASDPKGGAVHSMYQILTDSRLNHQCHVTGGILAEPCGVLLSEFFRQQRKLGKK
ncbi:MAG: tRNA adenosine(34) deaminase TadA [Planctomycetaceae bacterium]|jgi:tRNA(adenine34) deaminase|nr:tRNA adenosine(34) deaminase TadA [Planctomycetaceae bacterium]